MTIKDYYAFLREVQQLYYPGISLKTIKEKKNVKDAYECKKIEEGCVKCHNTNYFEVPKPKTIPTHQPTKKPKTIPPTPKPKTTPKPKSTSIQKDAPSQILTITKFIPQPTNMNKIQKYIPPNKYVVNDVPFLIKNLNKPNINILMFQSEYFKNIVKYTNFINDINSLIYFSIRRGLDIDDLDDRLEEFLENNNAWSKFKREAFTYWTNNNLSLRNARDLIDNAFDKFIRYLITIIIHAVKNYY